MGSRSRKKKGDPPGQRRFRWHGPLPVQFRNGGKRKGAGRKAARRTDGRRVQASHRARPEVAARHPLHVVVRVVAGLPSLCSVDVSDVVLDVLEASHKGERFQIVHFSVQSTHIHLLVEVDGKDGLTAQARASVARAARTWLLRVGWQQAGELSLLDGRTWRLEARRGARRRGCAR